MGNVILTPRLALIADTVRASCFYLQRSVVADIGTDHAKLPIYLVNEQICIRAYAADIREGPLCAARKNIAKYAVFPERICTVKSDGLLSLPDDYQILVIAGMGGELIADILARGKPREGTVLVLSPMTSPEDLRRYLYENNCQISEERAVTERGKLYTVMQAVQTREKCTYGLLDCYVSKALAARKNEAAVAEYIRLIMEKQMKIIRGKGESGRLDGGYQTALSVYNGLVELYGECQGNL